MTSCSRPARPDCPHSSGRIRFRLWTDEDKACFRRLNGDPGVMRFFPSPLSAAASDTLLKRFMTHQQEEGFGVWPVEVCEKRTELCGEEAGTAWSNPRFAGFVGLLRVRFLPPFRLYSSHQPVEIGWRFLPEFWGRGLAYEAARACLAFAFRELGLEEVISFTAVSNIPSRRLMTRLGMSHDPEDDFDHPSLPDDHPLLRHVLYRLTREEFLHGRSPSAEHNSPTAFPQNTLPGEYPPQKV